MKRATLIAAAVGVVIAAGAALAVAGRDGEPPPAPPPVTALAVSAGPGRTTISPAERTRIAGSDAVAASWLAKHESIRGSRMTAEVTWDARDARDLAKAAAGTASSVALTPRIDAVDLRLPVIRQAYRNNCETAALSMALRGAHSQRALQVALPQARPLDPDYRSGGMVWGDPNAGFVGRVEGGGFGVFEEPLARLGARYDPGTTVVRASTFDGVLDQVRAGRPVVAWTGLGASAPWTWTTPAGRAINADRSHHTVVLAGVGLEGVTVHDPWTGAASVVSRASLAEGWERLGRRAVAMSPESGVLTSAPVGA